MASCKECDREIVCRYYTQWGNVKQTKTDRCQYFKNKADFQEVKHGEWVDSENGGYVCSVCNCWMEDYYGSTPEQLQYCFKCGAKMDGGKNE